MNLDDSIKKANKTKNQSNQDKQTSSSTKQIFDFGKGIVVNYGRNDLGRPTNESYEGETDGGALFD